MSSKSGPAMATPVNPIELPGFGKPLNARDELKYSINKTEKFPIALIDEGYEAQVLPMRDYVIMELVNNITDKSDWHCKVFDEAIVAKWKAEILDSNPPNAIPTSTPATVLASTITGIDTADHTSMTSDSDLDGSQWSAAHATMDVSPRMFDWVIAEVKYKAEVFKRFNFIEALDGVWISDTCVSEVLRKGLEEAVRPLENVPEIEQDWHPGSNRQVLDLVHPSIYPLVYGQSRILESEIINVDDCTSWIGKGSVIQLPPESDNLGAEWSTNYQWLPAEFEISPSAEDVTVQSYINNLNPRYHANLYSVISQIVSKAIPLWDRVLSRVIAPPMQARLSDWSNSFQGYSEPDFKFPDQEDDEDDDEYEARLDAGDIEDMRDVIQPEPGNFKTPAERIRDYRGIYERGSPNPPNTEPCVDLRRDHGQLQIIVKLANIHLTPGDPEYPGGSWHVEGQANESICASALYYYSSLNITDSYLSFRQQTHDGAFQLRHAQGEWKAVEEIYGFKNGEPAVQNLGKILTRESRLLCFPNVMQHRVSPFQLADPSKPGHRKLLALFLVDPHIKIISTEDVPPQQHSWWKENVATAGVFDKLPPELAEMVLNGDGFPISLQEARDQRLDLMDERKDFALQNEHVLKEKRFSLCEH